MFPRHLTLALEINRIIAMSDIQYVRHVTYCTYICNAYEKNCGSGKADQRQRTNKFLKKADQCEAEAPFLISGPAEAD